MGHAEQLVATGIVNGAAYGLLGAGFALIYGVTGRFHFAYSLTYTLAAVAAVTAVGQGLPLGLAIVIGLAVAGLSGPLFEVLIYRPVDRHTSGLGLLGGAIASLGITTAGQNAIQWSWGTETARTLPGLDIATVHLGSNVTVTSLDVGVVIAVLCVVAVLALVLRRSAFGRSVSAVKESGEMARLVGVSPEAVGVWVFAIGSVCAGLLGIAVALKTAATPDMGFTPLFYAFVVAFLAGTRRAPAVVAATGFGLGILESISTLVVPTTWATTVVFGVLFLYLVAKAFQLRSVVIQP